MFDSPTRNARTTFAISASEPSRQVSVIAAFSIHNVIKMILATRLKEHISSHAKIRVRDYACEFCAKQFLSHRQLKNHQVYHEQPKFTCKECGKAFYKKILLEGHQKTHFEQKDFICPHDDCGKSYFLKTHLKRHIQSTHDKIK